jgi:hypothetical protein
VDNKCLNCDYARYTVHESKVGCAYWSVKYHEELGNEDKSDNDKSIDMFNSGLREAWDGWVYLRRRPEKKESEILGEGIMTNFCTIINEDAHCTKFKVRI